MKNLVANFSKQLTEAINIGSKATFTAPKSEIKNVMICGLGGSGIGGSIVSQLVTSTATVPINTSKGYFIPSYVNENTLVIISSYSGDTEETLQCMELAMKKNAKIVSITSGGTVQKVSKANGFDHIIVPGGMPPRSCLGYSLVQLFYVLGAFKIIGEGYKNELVASVKLIDAEETAIIAEGLSVAKRIKDKTPVIYATTNNEGVAIRLRQQLNENSKILCWHHIIPEMNHNELVGWTEKNENLAVLMLLDKDEYNRNLARVEINKEIIKKYTSTIIDIYSKGNSAIEKAIYFIHLGDWISVLLGELRNVDMMEVKVIDHLKSALSKI